MERNAAMAHGSQSSPHPSAQGGARVHLALPGPASSASSAWMRLLPMRTQWLRRLQPSDAARLLRVIADGKPHVVGLVFGLLQVCQVLQSQM